MESGMSLVHIYGHKNSEIPTSTLIPIPSLNVRMYSLSEHIILNQHVIPSVSINVAPVYSNITHSISYKISKRRLLQHWDDRNLNHTANWDKIDPTSFKQARKTTNVYMANVAT